MLQASSKCALKVMFGLGSEQALIALTGFYCREFRYKHTRFESMYNLLTSSNTDGCLAPKRGTGPEKVDALSSQLSGACFHTVQDERDDNHAFHAVRNHSKHMHNVHSVRAQNSSWPFIVWSSRPSKDLTDRGDLPHPDCNKWEVPHAAKYLCCFWWSETTARAKQWCGSARHLLQRVDSWPLR